MIHIYLTFYMFECFLVLFPYDTFLLSKVQERKKGRIQRFGWKDRKYS